MRNVAATITPERSNTTTAKTAAQRNEVPFLGMVNLVPSTPSRQSSLTEDSLSLQVNMVRLKQESAEENNLVLLEYQPSYGLVLAGPYFII